MEITVVRDTFLPTITFGKLSIDGVPKCDTLEPTYREVPGQPVASWKVQNQTAIPVGRYPVTIRNSPKFERDMPHIENTPGYTQVMIHWGNWAKDTDGCTLVGTGRAMQSDNGPMVTSSKTAFAPIFDEIQAALNAGQEVWYTVSGQPTA